MTSQLPKNTTQVDLGMPNAIRQGSGEKQLLTRRLTLIMKTVFPVPLWTVGCRTPKQDMRNLSEC